MIKGKTGAERRRGGRGGVDLLSLLGAGVRTGGVQEFQGPGGAERWIARRRGSGRPLGRDARLWDRRYHGVAVEHPELQEEQRGQAKAETRQSRGNHSANPLERSAPRVML